MTSSNQKIVIFGAGETAEIAYEYFTYDSDLEVAAFSVEASYLKESEKFGLPIVPLEEIETYCPPQEHQAFVAVSYTQLNRVRTRLYTMAKDKGYSLASYISSRAFVWRNAIIGDNCFIFENNVIQYGARIGSNVVLWSGNHIGHQSIIEDNCFVSSHVVVSGYCKIGSSSFLGVNSSIADNTEVGKDCVIGAGAVVTRNAEGGKVYTGNPAEPAKVSSLRLFKVKDEVG